MAWIERGNARCVLPPEWVTLGGRIQVGKDKIIPLTDWQQPATLEPDVIHRVFAGPYVAELLLSTKDGLTIAGPAREFLPRELRKPLALSSALTAAVFALWLLIFRAVNEVEAPYARLRARAERADRRSCPGDPSSLAPERSCPKRVAEREANRRKTRSDDRPGSGCRALEARRGVDEAA